MTKEMLNAKEIGAYLGINEKQVYRLVKHGKLPAKNLTGKWLFPKALIAEYLINRAGEKASAPVLDQQHQSRLIPVSAGIFVSPAVRNPTTPSMTSVIDTTIEMPATAGQSELG